MEEQEQEQIQKITKRNSYMRTFMRNKYNNNTEYRDSIKAYNKSKYVRKTVDCEKCKSRYYQNKLVNNICYNCLDENNVKQIKSKRGRKPKPKTEPVSDSCCV